MSGEWRQNRLHKAAFLLLLQEAGQEDRQASADCSQKRGRRQKAQHSGKGRPRVSNGQVAKPR